jgi:hypothetical protein
VLELRQIASKYDELLKGEPSVSARLNEATVGTKIGDALGSAALACEALQEPEQARVHFVTAAAAFRSPAGRQVTEVGAREPRATRPSSPRRPVSST